MHDGIPTVGSHGSHVDFIAFVFVFDPLFAKNLDVLN